MTDDLLTSFRSEMPMPDEQTTERIYERATSGRRNLVTRRSLIAVVAVLAAAGIAGGLSLTLGGSSGKTSTVPTGPHPGGPGGGMALAPFTMNTNYDNGTLSSIDLTLRSVHSDSTLEVKVVSSDGTVVFDQQETPTVYDSTMQDATHASWSGTLNPSDWNGGCQAGSYRIDYSFGPEEDSGSTDSFSCTSS